MAGRQDVSAKLWTLGLKVTDAAGLLAGATQPSSPTSEVVSHQLSPSCAMIVRGDRAW
jgi:hypothetical protein